MPTEQDTRPEIAFPSRVGVWPNELEKGARPARLLAALGPEKWIVVMQAVAVTGIGGSGDADVLDGGSDRLAQATFGIGDTPTEGPRPALEALAAVAPFSADTSWPHATTALRR
ncbi:hypothetical protein [Pseudonocardia zijingensis]|uniref:Uncharacterized protein n=1 Tax=Pseudonocardia zijingensis TaxID=153376 RepID=A0ABN1NLE9_9PSEU